MVETDPFRTRDHVADFDEIVRDIVGRSEAARARLDMLADIAYGAGPDETLDLFFPNERRQAMPVHIFIHGGYWRMFSKSDYSYVAKTVTQAGAIAVIIDYSLMPDVRMEHIIDQVRRAKRWVIDTIAEYQGDPNRLTISGHSAGAHLATFLVQSDPSPSGVEAALLLGGLYDLKPLQSSFLQPLIGLTDDEVFRFSPLGHTHDPATRVSILVGSEETPPFHQQAEAFQAVLQSQGLSAELTTLADSNHVSSVRDLGIPTSETGRLLHRLIDPQAA
jgi:arylformamidase